MLGNFDPTKTAPALGWLQTTIEQFKSQLSEYMNFERKKIERVENEHSVLSSTCLS